MMERRKSNRMRLRIDIGVFDIETKKRVGRLVDISTEGIMLAGGEDMRINEVYEFKIYLPVSIYGKNEISFKAVCLWCNKEENSSICQAGFQLRDPTPELKELILFWIENPKLE